MTPTTPSPSLPSTIVDLADTIERAHASLAAAQATAEKVRLANREARVAVERFEDLLRTLEGTAEAALLPRPGRPAHSTGCLRYRLKNA